MSDPRKQHLLRWCSGLLLLSGLLAFTTGCTVRPRSGPVRHEFQSVHMAIPFRLVLYSPDPVLASNAAAAAWARIEELNGILSDYDPESELSRLGASSPHASPVVVSPELFHVLEIADAVSRASEGAFDITVGPMTQLWRRSRRQRALPEMPKLEAARASTGWSFLRLGPGRSVRLLRSGMRLDAGGIAKGYALDEAARVLREQGIESALIAGAGDIRVTEPPPGTNGWGIEVPTLEVPGAPPSTRVLLRNASLCTSGDLFQFIEIDGVRYSHIVNPRTGLGLTHRSRVTVVGKDAITTDALSTALSVAGASQARRVVRSFGAEYQVVEHHTNGVVVRSSPGFKRLVAR